MCWLRAVCVPSLSLCRCLVTRCGFIAVPRRACLLEAPQAPRRGGSQQQASSAQQPASAGTSQRRGVQRATLLLVLPGLLGGVHAS